MYTHKIISKEFENGVLVLGVEFTDGTKTITEAVKPQDEAGFKYWLQQRLTSLNSLSNLEKVAVNTSVDVTDPVVVKTPEEIAEEEWFRLYNRWVNVKNNLIDTGVVPANNAKAVALLQSVKDGLLPAYIDKL
jgi:hypothetical protein